MWPGWERMLAVHLDRAGGAAERSGPAPASIHFFLPALQLTACLLLTLPALLSWLKSAWAENYSFFCTLQQVYLFRRALRQDNTREEVRVRSWEWERGRAKGKVDGRDHPAVLSHKSAQKSPVTVPQLESHGVCTLIDYVFSAYETQATHRHLCYCCSFI